MSNTFNFPENLDIRPSSAPAIATTAPEEVHAQKTIEPLDESIDGRFDYAAQEDAIRTYGIAGRVWEASYAMLAYLDAQKMRKAYEFDPPPFTHLDCPDALTILELGSGTGLVAARIAERVHRETDLIIATDLPEVCPLLESNLHQYSAIRVRPLAWGNYAHASSIASELGLSGEKTPSPSRHPTHIVCSDLVYFPALLAPLLRTLLHLTSPPFTLPKRLDSPAQVLISYKIRSLVKETPFWSAFGLWFSLTPVFVRGKGIWSRFVPAAGDDETFVFVAHRKPESMAWQVSEDDRKLLAGVGAGGTSEGKADDAFEAILFMNMDVAGE